MHPNGEPPEPLQQQHEDGVPHFTVSQGDLIKILTAIAEQWKRKKRPPPQKHTNWWAIAAVSVFITGLLHLLEAIVHPTLYNVSATIIALCAVVVFTILAIRGRNRSSQS